MEYAIAVIDIGMTNKKVAVYDDALRQLDAKYRSFAPKIVDGLETHDLEGMEEWFLDELAQAAKRFSIKAIAVSTHGATFVCLGRDGKAALPCVYYTHDPGGDFHQRFYETFGSATELQARTGTLALDAMINSAKGLYFAQRHFRDEFKNVATVLHYPQYWGFRLTGNAGMESTCMGCHTYLWDQVDGCLSSVARDLGMTGLLPEKLSNSWDALGTIRADIAERTGLAPDTIVTLGIHDSNASLLPHFAKKGETGFTINSTGTWCVTMNPVKEYGFARDEIGKAVFFNISAFGTPVKTALFMGGQEMETWAKVLMSRHARDDFPDYDEALYRKILRDADCFLLPELLAGTGQFPGSKPRIVEGGKTWDYDDIKAGASLPPCFDDYENGFAVLQISLAMQSLVALERTGLQRGSAVITEGGFRKSAGYNRILSAALRDNGVYLTGIAEATALGAAMTAKMALTGKSLADLAGDFDPDYREVEKSDMPELFSYREAWMAHVAPACD